MSCRKVVPALLVAGAALAFAVGAAFAQIAPGGGGAPGGGPGAGGPGGRGGFRAPDFKQLLGATDDEWKVLQPKIENLQALQMELRRSQFQGMGMGGRRPRGGEETAAPGATPAATPSDLLVKTQALTDVLASADADPKDIAAKMTDVRAAREKVRADIKKAQDELKELLTPRQEATLLLRGMMD